MLHCSMSHSNRRHFHRIALLTLCSALLVACTPSMPTVTPVRFSELTEQAMTELPMVIEVQKGDQIPVKVSLRGNMLESPADAKPIVFNGNNYAGTVGNKCPDDKDRGRYCIRGDFIKFTTSQGTPGPNTNFGATQVYAPKMFHTKNFSTRTKLN